MRPKSEHYYSLNLAFYPSWVKKQKKEALNDAWIDEEAKSYTIPSVKMRLVKVYVTYGAQFIDTAVHNAVGVIKLHHKKISYSYIYYTIQA